MTTNLLTPEQASFETGISGWEAVDSDPTAATTVPRNLLTEEQATFTTNYQAGATQACGWAAASGSPTVAWDQAVPSVKVTSAATTAITFQVAGNVTAPATPGLTYTFLARYRGTTNSQFALQFQNAAGGSVGGTFTPSLPAGEWATTRLTAVAPAAAAKVYAQVIPRFTAVGQTYEFTQAALYEGDVPDWHAPSESWAKNLLSDEQARMETNVVAAPPDVVAGWTANGASRTLEWATEQIAEGSHAIKMKFVTTGEVRAYVASGPVQTSLRTFPAVPGKGYSAVADLYPSPTATNTHLAIDWRDGAGAIVGSAVNGFSNAPGQTWRTAWVRGICPTGAVGFTVKARIDPTTAPAAGYLDKAAVYNDYVGAWFDVRTVTIAQANDTAPDGSKVLAITRLAPTGVGEARTTTAITAVPGRTYTGMADFASTVARSGRVYLEVLDTGGTVVGGSVGVVTPGTGFDQALVTAVAPTGATKARLRVQALGMAQGEVLRVDRAGLMDGPATTWVPGGASVPPSVEGQTDPYRPRVAIIMRDFPADTPVTIERILPGGRTEPVRHATSVPLTGGIAEVDDYDVPTDTPYQYRVTQGALVVTSAAVTLESADTFWLGEPNLGLMVRVIAAANAIPEWTREAPSGVHRVLGRADPVVVSDTRWWASGELTLYSLTENQRQELGDIFAYGTTLGFYGPQAILGGIGRIYLLATTVDERRVSARGYETPREWRSDIIQVAEPTGAASAPVTVTWEAVVAAYPTWQAVVNGEHDWLDVMTGVPGTEARAPNVGWEW